MRIYSRGLRPYLYGLGLIVPLSLGAVAAVLTGAPESAEAKSPGSTYCFYGKCHRVKSLAETEALVGVDETLAASHYDDCRNDRYNPCGLTSSGEVFRPGAADNAASPIYPDGTALLIWAPDTRQAAVVRINNAGPYWGNRKLDVSQATAERLGFKSRGVAQLKVRVVDAPDSADARYKKHRRYEQLPGYIGKYDSLDEAQAGMSAAMGLDAVVFAEGSEDVTPKASARHTELLANAAGVELKAATQLAAAELARSTQIASAAKVKVNVVPVQVADAGAAQAAPPQKAAKEPERSSIVKTRIAKVETVERSDRGARVASWKKEAKSKVASKSRAAKVRVASKSRANRVRVAKARGNQVRVANRGQTAKRAERYAASQQARGGNGARPTRSASVAGPPNDTISVWR